MTPTPPSKSAPHISASVGSTIGPWPESPSISQTSPDGVETTSGHALASLLSRFPMPRRWGSGSGVSQDVVAECLVVLKMVLPTFTLRPEVAWQFLQDLTEAEVREAVVLTIQHAAEIYPSTNWIALLRTAARRWCTACDGTGRYETSTGFEKRCDCRDVS